MRGVAVVRFTAELSRWEPETFVRTRPGGLARRVRGVGRRQLSVRARTGRAPSRCCGRWASSTGFRADKIDPVCVRDVVVSSTRMRRLLAEGRVDEAGVLLGRHFFIDGQVVAGDERGRSWGSRRRTSGRTTNWCRPTASTPRSRGRSGRILAGRDEHRRAADVRRRRAPPPSRRTCCGAGGTFTASALRLYFVQRLRDERAFESADALEGAD